MPASVNVGPSKPPDLNARTPPKAAPALVSDAGSSGGATSAPPPKLAMAPPPTPKQAAANAAAKTNTSLQSYLSYLQTNMGREAQSIIGQETAPIISGYTAQQKAGDATIVGDTQTYVSQLQQIGAQASQAYTTAEGQQQSLDAAIGSALQGGDVGAAASRLSAALAAAGQNTAPGAAAQAAASQTGASLFTSGSASLSQLFAAGAAQNAYDATLPGIAKSAGLQGLATYNAGLTSAEQTAVSAAQAKLPSIMNALNAQAKTQVSAAQETYKEAQPKIYGSGSAGYFALLPNGKNVQLTAPGAAGVKTFSSGGNEYELDPKSGSLTQLTANPKPVKAAKAPTTKTVGGVLYQYDPNTGTWAKAAGTPLKGTTGALPKGVTNSSVDSYLKSITKYGTSYTKTAGGHTTTHEITGHTANYETAYKHLRQLGLGDQTARGYLNSYFSKGQDGRAYLTNEEQAVLGKYVSKQPKDVGPGQQTVRSASPFVSGGFAYLSPGQVADLRANKMLPAGKLVDNDTGPKIKGFPPGTKLWAILPNG